MLRFRLSLAVQIAAMWYAVVPASAPDVNDLPKPTDYVSDAGHVMSPETRLKLNRLCGEVDHEAHAHINVVTIDTTNGEPIQQYAVGLEHAWRIGADTGRDVIVLVAVNDRTRFIETGSGLEVILPEGEVRNISHQMDPMLRDNDFDGAATLAVDEITQIIAQNAGVQLQPLTRWGAAKRTPHASIRQSIGGIIFFIFVVIFLLWVGRAERKAPPH